MAKDKNTSKTKEETKDKKVESTKEEIDYKKICNELESTVKELKDKDKSNQDEIAKLNVKLEEALNENSSNEGERLCDKSKPKFKSGDTVTYYSKHENKDFLVKEVSAHSHKHGNLYKIISPEYAIIEEYARESDLKLSNSLSR